MTANCKILDAAPISEREDALLHTMQLLETAARRFADGSDTEPTYVLNLCSRARAALARYRNNQKPDLYEAAEYARAVLYTATEEA